MTARFRPRTACGVQAIPPALGINGDAIHVPRYLGAQAVTVIGEGLGCVLVDPGQRQIVFFVAAGTAVGWDVPDTHAVLSSEPMNLPPEGQLRPPGRYWLFPPAAGSSLTEVSVLRRALNAIAARSRRRR